MRPPRRTSPAVMGLLLAAFALFGHPALAQEPDASEPAAETAPAKKKPPVRRPAPKPAAKPAAPASADPSAPASSSGGEQPTDPAPEAAAPRRPAPRPPKPAVVKPPAAKPPVAQPEAASAPPPTPAAIAPPQPPVASEPPSACEDRAALYDGQKGFSAHVTRLGRIEAENPLRPLTPDVTRVLQLTIGGKVATAYGPDLTALRRGGSPAALESQLGGGIRWEPSLPLLPETLAIVSEAGEPLARLAFRACTDAPAVKAPPPQAAAKDRKPGARRSPAAEAPKVPPGFHLPQGAIAQ